MAGPDLRPHPTNRARTRLERTLIAGMAGTTASWQAGSMGPSEPGSIWKDAGWHDLSGTMSSLD